MPGLYHILTNYVTIMSYYFSYYFFLLCHMGLLFFLLFSYYDTLFFIIFPIIFNYDRVLASGKWQGADSSS